MIHTPIISIPIHDLSRAGNGVGRLADGRIVFVPFTCPGDQVQIQIESEEKKYVTAKLIAIESPSPQRVVPPCPVFGECGGCSWQHIPYSLQWKTKSGGIAHALKRVGVTEILALEELPAEQIWNYRNRIQLHGETDGKSPTRFGFFEPGSKNIVTIDDCKIARKELNEKFPSVKTQAQSNAPRTYKVELEVFPDGEVKEYWNSKHAAGGFRQVHDSQNLKLKAWVSRAATADSNSRTLFDLYGGSGNLSLDLSSKFQQIYCVDYGGSTLSGQTTRPENFHLVRADVAKWLVQFPKNPDVTRATAILDPPRIGLGADFDLIEKYLRVHHVASIVAVGCDVDAWAKDVSRFVKRGWLLTHLAALDLFPQTPHVESLARLEFPL